MASAPTGIVARGLVAWATMFAGSALASFPEVHGWNVVMVVVAPSFLFLFSFWCGVLAFALMAAAWVAFVSYFRFNRGKWTLLLPYSANCYDTMLASRYFYPAPSAQSSWSVRSWAITLPVFVALIIAIPDLANHHNRKGLRS